MKAQIIESIYRIKHNVIVMSCRGNITATVMSMGTATDRGIAAAKIQGHTFTMTSSCPPAGQQ